MFGVALVSLLAKESGKGIYWLKLFTVKGNRVGLKSLRSNSLL